MTFKLKSLTLENFMSFVDRTVIDFSNIAINNIEGTSTSDTLQSNGAGKSSIIDAISLALFGKGIRETYIGSYVSNINSSGGIYIGLELIDESSNVLKIERWRRPNSETNKAKVWFNSKCISTDSTISKIDELIQSYIGVSHNNFLSCIFSVMLPGFLKLRPSLRFEMLEQALALKKIEYVIKKINTSIKNDEDKLSATKDSMSEKHALLAAEETKKTIYENNFETIRSNILDYEKELEKLLLEEQEKLKVLNKYQQFLTGLTSKVDSNQIEISNLSGEIYSLDDNITKLYGKLKIVLSSIKKNTLGKYECDVCRSPLTNVSKETVKAHYGEEIGSLLEVKKEKESALVILKENQDKFIENKNKVELSINSCNRQLNNVRSDILSIEKSLINSKKALSDTQDHFSEELLKSLKLDISNLHKVKKELENNLKISYAWKQAMSKNGLRLSYIKEEISTLSAIASKYTSAVYERPMAVKFFIDDEKDNPSLDFSINGKSANMMSTGERGRLEIAMTLSLMCLLKTAGMNLEFLVLDEALDGLSLTSKQAVLNVIKSISSEYQILMISHDPIIRNMVGTYTIQVCKDITTGRSSIKTRQVPEILP